MTFWQTGGGWTACKKNAKQCQIFEGGLGFAEQDLLASRWVIVGRGYRSDVQRPGSPENSHCWIDSQLRSYRYEEVFVIDHLVGIQFFLTGFLPDFRWENCRAIFPGLDRLVEIVQFCLATLKSDSLVEVTRGCWHYG